MEASLRKTHHTAARRFHAGKKRAQRVRAIVASVRGHAFRRRVVNRRRPFLLGCSNNFHRHVRLCEAVAIPGRIRSRRKGRHREPDRIIVVYAFRRKRLLAVWQAQRKRRRRSFRHAHTFAVQPQPAAARRAFALVALQPAHDGRVEKELRLPRFALRRKCKRARAERLRHGEFERLRAELLQNDRLRPSAVRQRRVAQAFQILAANTDGISRRGDSIAGVKNDRTRHTFPSL